ncbi:MAG: deoxycytidine triphosphate deaminase [Gammaproteobacteria bacterium]|nr:deoxycytidine triphosphate deaminase [Gammaproteobacteria bacterium]
MSNDEKIKAATFDRIVKHLRDNPDVQNIDLMNLANFCRNCISKWYVSESEKLGDNISYDDAREIIYGMPYSEYKSKFQKEATKEQLEKFNANKKS